MKIYLILLAFVHILSLGAHLARHGEKQERKINFFHKLIILIITWAIIYFCGLFNYI